MVKILINNSFSQIVGLNTADFRALRKILSYESDPSAKYFSGGWTRTKYLLDKKGFFPTGLLYLVEKFTDNRFYKVTDLRKKPKSANNVVPRHILFKLSPGINPYPSQLDASIIAGQRHRGGIVMPTGTGKSLTIALIIEYLQVRTLIVVPTLEIKKQLQQTIDSVLGKTNHIVIENIDSSRLDTLTDFDCLIIDECHHAAAKTYQRLNKTAWINIYYRFFLTATFFRNQTNEQLLFEGIAGRPIYTLTYRAAVLNNYIVPVDAYYCDLGKTPTDAYTWREVYDELIIHNERRNDVIASLIITLQSAKKSTLCLIKEIEHGEILSKLTGIPFVSGQDESSRKFIDLFNTGAITALIGTTGVLGEGVDTKPAEYIIIAGLGKAKSAFLQQIGRGVRTYPGKESCKVIIFKDSSHKFTLRHFNIQKKIFLDELNVKLVKL